MPNQAPSDVTFDFSKSTPLPAANPTPPPQSGQTPPGVTFDFSKSVPLGGMPAQIGSGSGSAALAGDAIEGVGKGALKTATELGEMTHLISPETAAKGEQMATPSNAIQQLGSGAEDVGEWMAGDEALKGIYKLTKLAAHAPKAIQIAEKYPKTARLLMGSAKGAAIGGAKGALKGESTGDVGGEALGGAEGGAAGGLVSEAGGMALGSIGKAAGIGTEPTEDAVRAARPIKWNKTFNDDWQKAAPYLAKEMDAEGKYTDMKDAADRIRQTANDIWTNEAKPLVAAKQGNALNVTSVADRLENEAKTLVKIGPANKAKAEKLTDLATEFRQAKFLTVGEMEALIESNNNTMRATGMYERSNVARKAMIEADGNLKGAALANDELRNLMMQHIPELQKVKEAYGAMSNVATSVEGQQNVAARQAPISMKRIIGMTGGLTGHPAAAVPAVFDYYYNSPEKLLTRAVQKEAAAAGTGGAMQTAKTIAKEGAKKIATAVPKAAGENAGEKLKQEKSSTEVP